MHGQTENLHKLSSTDVYEKLSKLRKIYLKMAKMKCLF